VRKQRSGTKFSEQSFNRASTSLPNITSPVPTVPRTPRPIKPTPKITLIAGESYVKASMYISQCYVTHPRQNRAPFLNMNLTIELRFSLPYDTIFLFIYNRKKFNRCFTSVQCSICILYPLCNPPFLFRRKIHGFDVDV
jgi:hypothetical protein